MKNSNSTHTIVQGRDTSVSIVPPAPIIAPSKGTLATLVNQPNNATGDISKQVAARHVILESEVRDLNERMDTLTERITLTVEQMDQLANLVTELQASVTDAYTNIATMRQETQEALITHGQELSSELSELLQGQAGTLSSHDGRLTLLEGSSNAILKVKVPTLTIRK